MHLTWASPKNPCKSRKTALILRQRPLTRIDTLRSHCHETGLRNDPGNLRVIFIVLPVPRNFDLNMN
jgi:hypothetical protein